MNHQINGKTNKQEKTLKGLIDNMKLDKSRKMGLSEQASLTMGQAG